MRARKRGGGGGVKVRKGWEGNEKLAAQATFSIPKTSRDNLVYFFHILSLQKRNMDMQLYMKTCTYNLLALYMNMQKHEVRYNILIHFQLFEI